MKILVSVLPLGSLSFFSLSIMQVYLNHTDEDNALDEGFSHVRASESPGRLVKTQIPGPPSPLFLSQQIWGGPQEFVFLTSSQVILMLLE